MLVPCCRVELVHFFRRAVCDCVTGCRAGGAPAAALGLDLGDCDSGSHHNAAQLLPAFCACAVQVGGTHSPTAAPLEGCRRLAPRAAFPGCRKIKGSLLGRKKEAVAYYNIESAVALVVSLFINVFVLSVFAKGFYGSEAVDIGLENAGHFLGETFGQQMKYVWAVGLLAAGGPAGHVEEYCEACWGL